MYRAICTCVVLAVLSMSSSGQQTTGSNYGDQMAAEMEKSLADPHRPVRMHSPSSQQKPFQRVDRSIEQKNFGALVAKYLQRKGGPSGPSGRYAIVQNRPIIDPTHRINDRDYMGWMDFGRRSAEEYEYSS